MSVANIDQAQAAVDALIAELVQPDPGTVYVKVATLDLTGAGSGPNAVADIGLLVDCDADIICLQGGASWLSAITTAYAATWTILTPNSGSTDSEDVPILLRTDRWQVKTSGTIDSTHEVTWVEAIHLDSSQRVQVANTIGSPAADGEGAYATQMGLLTTKASQAGAQSVGIVAGSFGVDYINRNDANAYWPQRTLGAANYSFCWSYLSDDALGGASTLRGDGAHQVTCGIFHRKDSWIAWVGTQTVLTGHANSLGVLATYEVAVKDAVEPDETEADTTTPDQPPSGKYAASDLVVGSINLKITLSLADAREDFTDINAAAPGTGLDLFGMQEMQNSDRRDFFGTGGLAAFRDIHIQPNRTLKNGCDANPVGWRANRFAYASGSGKAVLLTDEYFYEADGDRAGLTYATEARMRDRLTGRYYTIWSMHTPPSVELSSGLPDPADGKRVSVLLKAMATMQRRAMKIPDDELFIVTGDFNWNVMKHVWANRPEVFFDKAGMDICWNVLGAHGTSGTEGSRWIDYIAISRRSWAKFTDLGVVTALHTDHDPPWATIRVKPA